MDSLTHIVVGACIGEAFFRKGFGKKAMFWGALAQSVPDVDFIAGFWLDTTENLLAHRGFTHSILFGILVIPLLALAADLVHRPYEWMLRRWLLFFAAEVFFHLFIDGFNNYGIGWFEPFTHHRISLQTIYVADPFFSFWPFIAFLALLILHRHHPWRRFWWRFGLIMPFVYLLYCCFNKWQVDREVREILAEQRISQDRYFTTPTPLNNWLWYTVAGTDSGYFIGYRSVFDRRREMSFTYFPKNDHLLDTIRDQADVQRLIRFSQGYYTVESRKDTLLFNDLRFGQVTGWHDPQQRFAFYYYLQHPEDNTLVVQRGRFANWNAETLRSLWRRIRGN